MNSKICGFFVLRTVQEVKSIWKNARTAYVENYRKHGKNPTYYLAVHMKFLDKFIAPDQNIYRCLQNSTQNIQKINEKICDIQQMILNSQ